MGGKTKQSQRTKNNARPSSSGRSAELLSSVKLDTGLVNIAATQLPALFPSLVAPTVDPLISPELQMCLKKLHKKDPITKTKALQELSQLVTNSKVDDVVSALPSWSHFYKILTADPDRKVRECTQACHSSIVSACGRRVAPHLRQLVPAWLQAQHDEHAPAHAHAAASLQKTFPDNKLPEVLSFCKSEILTHLSDILVGNAETAHIRKTDSPEDRELQVARVVSSSLHGLQYFVRHLPRAHDAWLWGEAARLLQAAAFWKRATSTDPRIRAAWYGAVGALVSRFPAQLAAAHGARTLRVLAGARDSNPLPAAHLWDCLLTFMHAVPDWHQYLENNDLLAKRILDVLESGGWGDARALASMLLPLLAALPAALTTSHFYTAFFRALFTGLSKKSILNSKSERQSWLTSLEECLRYLSTQQHEYVLEIVTAVHRTWLEKVLTDAEGPVRNHLIKYSAGSMANLVKYWLKQAQEGNDDKYDQLIRNFWLNVGSTLTTQIDNLPLNHDDIDRLIDAHILLLQTLKTSFTQEFKKQLSIKFELDAPAAEEKSPIHVPQCDPAIVERYNHNLNELATSICGHYFGFASEKQISNPVLSPLITLLVEFDSIALFCGVARQFNLDSVYALYETVLRTWLTGDTMRCRAVVDIVFMAMRHLSEEEQDAVFETFKQFPPSVVEWCISLSLSHPHFSRAAVRRWLRGALVASTVSAVCARLLHSGDGAAKGLLLMCLNVDKDGESIVSEDAVEAALRQVSASLCEVEAPALEARCACACALAAALPPRAPLLAALLALTAALQRGDPRLSPETWCEVRDAWQDAVTSLDPPQRARFALDAAATLHAHAHTHSSELNIGKIEHIVSLCPYILWNNSDLDIPEVIRFTKALFNIPPTDPLKVEAFATRHQILADNLNCPYEENDVTRAIINETLTELVKDDLVAHVNKCLFRSMYLRTMFLNQADDESEKNWCNELLSEKYFVDKFCQTIYDYAVISSLHEGYAFWPHYKLIEQSKTRLGAVLDDVLKEISIENKTNILHSLSELAATKGFFWSYARRYFEVQAKCGDSNQSEAESSQVENISSQIDAGSSTEEEIQNEVKSSETVMENDSMADNKIEDKTSDGKIESPSDNKVESPSDDKVESPSDNKVESPSDDKVESPSDDKVESPSDGKVESSSDGKVENPIVIEDWSSKVTGSGFFHTLQANIKNSTEWSEVVRTKYYLAVRGALAAHAGGALAGAAGDGGDAARCDPDVIVNAYYAHNHIMLYEMDISNAPWAQVVSNSSICSYFTSLITHQGWTAKSHQWDFTNITMCSLLTSVELSKHNWGTTKVALLARSVMRMFCAVSPFVSSVPERCVQSEPAPHVASLPAEWRDIYAPDLHNNLFSVLLFVLESSKDTVVNSNHVAVISALMECTRHMQWDLLGGAHRARYPLRRVVGACTATLRAAPHVAFVYLAHAALRVLLRPLVLEDAEMLAAWSSRALERCEADGAGPPLELTLLYYDEALCQLGHSAQEALAHVSVCEESCTLEPSTEPHARTLAYLLLGDIVNQQCTLARGDLKHHYIRIYREQKYTEPLLETALRLAPEAVLRPAPPGEEPLRAARDACTRLFTAPPRLDVYEWCGREVVWWCACRGVWWAVRGAGCGCARGWRGAANHAHAATLDHITARYITPFVVKEEFTLLQKRNSEIEDAEVTINWSSYEVTCVLTVDGKGIELTLSLSRQHPLVQPRALAPHPAAGSVHWLRVYLAYQNGTILNALKMWVESTNKKVERAAQCYICYCRLHHATGRLPSAQCRTCRNKFHPPCTRKWFSVSNKTTCPLCRGTF